ncbi:MAG: TonB-dependent receptor [Candidatus Kapaibacterium sp.]|nr:MAG: TonB-dependent receptor [Candidatus Kapabacteria bacterium]
MKRYVIYFLIYCFLGLSSLLAQEQTVSISGKVVNANDGKPVPGVTVLVEGTKLGAFTNSEGKFQIKGLTPGVYSVRFSAVGFETFVKANVYVTNVKPVFLEVDLVEKVVNIEGVEVRGKYFERFIETTTSTSTFSAEDIRRAPGVQEDIVRATALLPGVAVTSAGRNDLIVRGGAPFENLFIVDNIEVPNINHFGTQGASGGPLSIINIDFVKNVQFSAGGFGVKYGDRTSSLTQISLYNGNEEKFGGKFVISATGAGLNLEGPVNSKGTFFFSARRSYLDFIFKAANFAFIPEYWDFQGKLNFKLDELNTLTFLAIGALDYVNLNNDNPDNAYKNSRVAVPEQKQYFSGLNWKHIFNSGFFNITLGRTYTKFDTFQNDSNLVEILKNKSVEGETSLKADFEVKLSNIFNLSFGNQTKFGSKLNYDIFVDGRFRLDENGNPSEYRVDTSFSTVKNGTYVNLATSIGRHRVSFGLRGDYYNFTTTKYFVSPRISVSYMINPVSTIIFSLGRYYQSPSYIWLVGAPNQKLEPIRADQVVLGYEHTPFEDLKVQLEVYYKQYRNYPARVFRPQAVLSPSGFDDLSSDIPFGIEPLVSEGKGWARGVELLIQKRFNPSFPLYGLLSITVSQSKFAGLDGIERPSAYDSPLIFNLSLGYRFNPEWEVSYKYRAAIGQPTTPYLPNGRLDFSLYNEGERLPMFRQTDIRVDKRWFLKNFNIVTYLDIQNVFSTKNKTSVRWNFRERRTEYLESFGILPSIGVYLEF